MEVLGAQPWAWLLWPEDCNSFGCRVREDFLSLDWEAKVGLRRQERAPGQEALWAKSAGAGGAAALLRTSSIPVTPAYLRGGGQPACSGAHLPVCALPALHLPLRALRLSWGGRTPVKQPCFLPSRDCRPFSEDFSPQLNSRCHLQLSRREVGTRILPL